MKTVEAELARLVAFIKRGTASETVQQELGTSEARRRDLRAALDRLAQADAFRASAADLAQKLGTILGDWTDITRKPVVQQRQLLRKFVPDRLTVTPHVDAKRKWIDWAGDLAVAPIISGIAPAVGDTMPDDPMDRRWWPQGAAITGPFPVCLPVRGTLTFTAARVPSGGPQLGGLGNPPNFGASR